MILIQDLRFTYAASTFDLHVPTLKINSEQATAIVGPSGSGKTTLLHLIAGILTPDSGNLIVDDTDMTWLNDQQRRLFRVSEIGLIFQEFELIEYLSVLDNVLLPCRISDAVPLTSKIKSRALDLLKQTGLGRHANKPITKLSQGERQRVAISRALLTQPKILLADEPTGNLDPETSQQIMDLLLNAVSESEATLAMVTHDHSLLHRFETTVDFNQFLTKPIAANEGASP